MLEVPDDLAELLALWWMAERHADLALLGMPRECPSTAGFRSTARWDDQNGAADASQRVLVVRAIAAAVDALEARQRSAIHVLARNLATGAVVWHCARLPAGAEGEALAQAAVNALAWRLGLTAAAETA